MKVGIPRAFLYYKYRHLWETFFHELGIETIVSPETSKDIINRGMTYAIDEACLSSKIYLGHVEWLIGKCDFILVPRIANYGSNETLCTKFHALHDVVYNTFRDRDINLLNYNIEVKNSDYEFKAFLKMGKTLGKRKSTTLRSYLIAKQAEKTHNILEQKKQEELLESDKTKILLVSHPYNLEDKYFGAPIINYLENMDVIPIIGEFVNKREAVIKSKEISDTLPWVYNKELVGSVAMYKDRVDGIILISSFPCGPDSLVNEIINRRVKDKPILTLIIDGQEGTAGIETRLESFLDIIKFKKEDYSGKV